MKNCYLIFMSSGLDSTATLIKIINEKILEDDLIFPLYIWWRSKFTVVLEKELRNCHKILDFINKKYEKKNFNLTELNRIDIPLIYYENVREEFKNLSRDDYWCHFRNALFILSSLSYLINNLKLKDNEDSYKLTLVAGFLGTEPDDDEVFVNNIKQLIIDFLKSPSSHSKGNIKDIDFYCPYINKSEKIYDDIYKFDCWDILEYTWSCWRKSDVPCYNCGGCHTRKTKYDQFKFKRKKSIDPFFNE